MAISRQQKEQLLKQYVQDLESASNVVILQQNAIEVPTATQVRKNVVTVNGKFNVVRKRLFMKALEQAWYETVDLEKLEGSVVVLYANSDEYGPLKEVNKFAKEFAKAWSNASFKFLGGWYDKKWNDGEYVTDLANIPSREELLSKLAYLFNYPLQHFAATLDQVAKSKA